MTVFDFKNQQDAINALITFDIMPIWDNSKGVARLRAKGIKMSKNVQSHIITFLGLTSPEAVSKVCLEISKLKGHNSSF